jgi:hypothetical protein
MYYSVKIMPIGPFERFFDFLDICTFSCQTGVILQLTFIDAYDFGTGGKAKGDTSFNGSG